MEVVDSQVHIWKKDSPDHPWDPEYGKGGPSAAAHRAKSAEHTVSYEDTIRAMDDADVDAAVIVTTILYGWDNSYSLEAARKHPDRFVVMGRVEPFAPGVDDRVRAWKETPGTVGIRVVVTTDPQREQVTSGALEPFFAAAERQDVPVAIFAPRFLPEIEPIARKHPGLALHLDHVGLPQPPLMPADPDPFERLPTLLALAKYPRVAVKLSAAPTLSLQKFPFADLWPSVHKIIAAFGPERVLWGSDWTRALPVVSYKEQVRAFTETNELDDREKELIMGKSLRTLLRWPKAATASR
jgi:L-fuconolactonase